VQQLRSFGDLHGSELEALALELDALQPEIAARVRTFAAMQRDEGQLVVDELQDIQADMKSAEAQRAEDEDATQPPPEDAWKASPKRAAWLAEQTRPRTRRDLFGR
jgi:hypothetical protein